MPSNNFIYQRIIEEIESAIRIGKYSPGERLPSERKLAETFGVHRSTIKHALDALSDQGLVTRKLGSGTYVNTSKWRIQTPPSILWSQHYPLKSEALTPYEKSQKDFASLHPAISWQDLSDGDLPHDWLPQLSEQSFSWDNLWKNAEEEDRLGDMGLRLAVQDFLYRHYQLKVSPPEILITSGTQQALFLLSQGLLRPGDAIAIEAPSYFYGLTLFQAAGLRIIPIHLDREGISLNQLEKESHRHAIKMLFLNPSFQNPTSISMSTSRMKAVLDFCSFKHIPIFEDDASGLISFNQSPQYPMKCLDDNHQIIYSGSISKFLGQHIRIGWMIGPAKLMEDLSNLRHAIDAGLSIFPQKLIESFLHDGADKQIAHITQKSQQHSLALTHYLKEKVPSLKLSPHSGGFYLYGHLPKLTDALFRQIHQTHLIGYDTTCLGDPKPALRFNVSRYNEF